MRMHKPLPTLSIATTNDEAESLHRASAAKLSTWWRSWAVFDDGGPSLNTWLSTFVVALLLTVTVVQLLDLHVINLRAPLDVVTVWTCTAIAIVASIASYFLLSDMAWTHRLHNQTMPLSVYEHMLCAQLCFVSDEVHDRHDDLVKRGITLRRFHLQAMERMARHQPDPSYQPLFP